MNLVGEKLEIKDVREYKKRMFLRKEEVAEILLCSVRTVERRIEEGKIPIKKFNDRVILIPAQEFFKTLK